MNHIYSLHPNEDEMVAKKKIKEEIKTEPMDEFKSEPLKEVHEEFNDEVEIKTEIEIVENWKPSFNDQNWPTQSDLNKSENRNDVMDISIGPVFSLTVEGNFCLQLPIFLNFTSLMYF